MADYWRSVAGGMPSEMIIELGNKFGGMMLLGSWRHRMRRCLDNLQDYFSSDIINDDLFWSIRAHDEDYDKPPGSQDFGNVILGAWQSMTDLKTLALGPDTHSRRALKEDPNSRPSRTSPARSGSIYDSVKLGKLQIRLLHLLPGQPQDPIRATLIAVDSLSFGSDTDGQDEDSTKLLYDALSYVWASSDKDVNILVNDVPLSITGNLNHALHYLRSPVDTRVLWIDAICINQEDEEEKSDQVGMMSQIYSNADNVVIYLGPEADESHIVMEYLTVDDSELQVDGELFTELSTRTTRSQGKALRQSVDGEREFLVDYFSSRGIDEDRAAQAAYRFFCRPYWMRMWVLQEAKLARRDPVWCCGSQTATTQRMRERLPALHNFTLIKKQPAYVPIDETLSADARGRRRQFEDLMAWTQGAESLFFTADPELCSPEYQDLCTLLARSSTRHSTDPKDRIYALVGMLEPLARATLAPDYTLSTHQVFLEATIHLITQEAKTNGFHLYGLNRAEGVPSWSLDFSTPLSPDASHWLHRYDATYWDDQPFRAAIYHKRLILSGIDVDQIHVCSNLRDDISNLDVLRTVRDRERMLNKYRRLMVCATKPASDTWQISYLLPPSFEGDMKDMDSYVDALKDLDDEYRERLKGLSRRDSDFPGVIHFSCQVLKMLGTLIADYAQNMNCEDGVHSGLLTSPTGSYRHQLRVAMIAMTERFVESAVFELERLTSFIDDLVFNGSVMSSEPFGASARDSRWKYYGLDAALRAASCQEDLETLKTLAKKVAQLCHESVEDHLENGRLSTATEIEEAEKCIASAFSSARTALSGVAETYTRDSTQPEKSHATVEQHIHTLSQEQAMLEQVLHFLKERIKTERFCIEKIAILRQQTAVFMTKAGYFGLSFQHDPGFRKGDRVVMMDGFLAPMILREDGLGGQYKMMGAVFLTALDEVNVKELLQEGVLEKRHFEVI